MPENKLTRASSRRPLGRLEAGILGGVAAATTFTIIQIVPHVTHMELGVRVIALGMLGGFIVTWTCWHAWRRLHAKRRRHA